MTLILVAIALVSFGLYGTGYAFHDGGVARCEGCHTMHNSLNGTAMRTLGGMTQFNSGAWLLQGADASSACLNCHGTGDATSSYHVSTETVTAGGATVPAQYTPGGDFSWIKSTINSVGSNRGHNIISASFNYVQDARLTVSPGGSYPANVMGCSGCHDPHGKTRRLTDGSYVNPALGTAVLPIGESGSYGAEPTATYAVGAYRLLGGAGYAPVAAGGTVTFTNNPPLAVSPSSYNRTEGATMTRVVYGNGMSEWCANCHSGIHLTTAYTSGTVGLKHPAGNNATLGAIADNYNAYVSSGNLTGTSATSYNSLVPYEEQSTNVADMLTRAVTDNSQLAGPSASSTVSCISCHRAHATGFASMIRYDISDALITDTAGVFEPRSGMTDTTLTAAYYGRTAANFGVAQRILCNKCHAKD
jgi:hypothetical protein